MTALGAQPSTSAAGNGAPGSHEPADLLRSLLEESRELTAVERFAKAYEATEPAQARHYKELIPLSAPGEGEQYAFEVDLDACSGCKACVSACHHLNGLEPTETWRSVGQLYGSGGMATGGLPIVQHVTTACHHCVDPGCLAGCPTNSYEKDPVTGVVRHLDDQCFGCQYCTMACPYEVPQYSHEKGIVRKCDMCHGRLAEGEAPACVQACPNEAIRISVVSVAGAEARAAAGAFLPSSPPPALTKPTTIYKGNRPLPVDLRAADADHATPQHAHLPLVAMLVLTQLSVGAVAVGAVARWLGAGAWADATILLGMLGGQAGLAVAPLHLGRPHLAFRAVLGWRHSWLSREAIMFGVYAAFSVAAALYALLPLAEPIVPELPLSGLLSWLLGTLDTLLPNAARPLVELLAIATGALAVYCSARIYQFTGRVFWRGLRTHLKFAGSAAVLGSSLALAAAAVAEAATGAPSGLSPLIALVMFATLGKLAYEASTLRSTEAKDDDDDRLALSAGLMLKEFLPVTAARFALGAIGGLLAPLAVAVAGVGSWPAAAMAVTGLGCLLAGELAERVLYFGAVAPLRMPGGIKS